MLFYKDYKDKPSAVNSAPSNTVYNAHAINKPQNSELHWQQINIKHSHATKVVFFFIYLHLKVLQLLSLSLPQVIPSWLFTQFGHNHFAIFSLLLKSFLCLIIRLQTSHFMKYVVYLDENIEKKHLYFHVQTKALTICVCWDKDIHCMDPRISSITAVN